MADCKVFDDACIAREVSEFTADIAARIASTMAMTAMNYGQNYFFEVCCLVRLSVYL
jgi:hypothetical protein